MNAYINTQLFSHRTGAAAIAFLVGLTCQTGLFAQSAGSGTIVGTVKDPANAVVSAATVTVHNADTGSDRTVQTNDSGAYSATFLPPGPYEITVSKAGFTKVLRKDLTLQVGQVLTVDFALQVQAGSETVTVSGEAPIVDPSKTDVSQVVSTGFVRQSADCRTALGELCVADAECDHGRRQRTWSAIAAFPGFTTPLPSMAPTTTRR